MHELVSIIVPVYNTGAYLAPCLESLMGQTYKNLEIILVDDGSTDGSGAVCDEFAARDSRIRVIHQKNAGVSAARNAGLDACSGEFLTFLDADDQLEGHAVETALTRLLEQDVDMVAYGWQEFGASAGADRIHTQKPGLYMDLPQALRELLSGYSAFSGGYPGTKLWRVSVFGGEVPRFDPELYYFEDLEWVVRMLLRVRSFAVLPDALYRYRFHAASVSRDPAKAERRELGYHRSIGKILETLAPMPQLQHWFWEKYAPEIVNGVLFAWKNHMPQLRKQLLEKLDRERGTILRSDTISHNIKLRCCAIALLHSLRLL